MSEPAPRISVLMPVYNADSYLRDAIDSVLGQSFTDLELILVDDGSTDDSSKIINQYEDPRIRKYSNEVNLGIVPTRNKCVSLAMGEYVALLDADDISFPHRLEHQFSFLENHPNVGVLGTGFQFIDHSSQIMASYHFPEEHQLIAWSLFFFSSLANSTVMMRTIILRELGGYQSDEGKVNAGVEDYDLWFRAADHTQMHNLQEIYVQIRKHDTNITSVHASLHLDNVFRLVHEAMSEALQREIPYQSAVRLRINQARFDDIRILEELYWSFVQSRTLTFHEKYMISCDASQRILMSWRYLLKDGNLHKAILKALLINPFCVFRFVVKKVFKRGKNLVASMKNAE